MIPLVDADGMPFGLCVNLAARICALAGAGEVLVSDPVQALLARSERRFVAPQRVTLRGAPHPIRLWRLAETPTAPSEIVAAGSEPWESTSVRRASRCCSRAPAGNVVPVGAAARPRTLAATPPSRTADPPS